MGGIKTNIIAAVNCGPMNVFGHNDPFYTLLHKRSAANPGNNIKIGVVEQFNVGLYSALVTCGCDPIGYTCFIGAQNISPGFGYSDSNVLREGDEVIFMVTDEHTHSGTVLAKRPPLMSTDNLHTPQSKPNTGGERRTSFFTNDCYRLKAAPYSETLTNANDRSTFTCTDGRPTDIVPGEFAMMNQHHCGILGGQYSATIAGGGAHIRLFSLENRIRVVADSIIKYTITGNDNDWHNRKYLSHERSTCLYQEERFGQRSPADKPFDSADYDKDGYFTKNRVTGQTARPRIVEHEGYYGNLYARYCLRPDPDPASSSDDTLDIRSMHDKPCDPGVARESVDPSGQYRLATTGMLGFERIGRIPVPVRIRYPWQKEAKEPSPESLKEFKHDTSYACNRQLELADRVAYDLKNSYSRLDGADDDEFYTPDEQDLKDKLKDVYDPGFTESKTVNLQDYDKRRSGIWQGEDGSIILRDAWGSEIVMLAGNIQLSCAGNIEIMPGKSTMVLSGDDAVIKAQNSIDITAADKDVRINAYKNLQMMAGSDKTTGGVIIESQGPSAPWDGKTSDGESVVTNGITLKASRNGNIVTDAGSVVLRSRERTSLVSGDKSMEGQVFVSAETVGVRAETILNRSEDAAVLISGDSAAVVGGTAILSGTSAAMLITNGKYKVPLDFADVEDVAGEILDDTETFYSELADEEFASLTYTIDALDKMQFKFRSSEECGTDSAWELQDGSQFKIYQPFWLQVHTKFDTLKGIGIQEFDDHLSSWEDSMNPWPGTSAISSATYVSLETGPVNMDSDGLNKPRSEVVDHTDIQHTSLFPGYQIRG